MKVLMFHDVVNAQHSISGFQKIGASQYCLQEKKFIELVEEAIGCDRDVVLTFDDGGSSFYHVIAPILERYGKIGLFFISTAYIGSPGFMTAEEIKDLDIRGHIIASHSHSHPKIISKLSSDEMRHEWSLSKEILQSVLGHNIDTASVPGGAVSDNVIQSLIDSGYRTVYTSEPISKVKYIDNTKIMGRYTVTINSTPEYVCRLLTDKNFQTKLHIRYKLLLLGKKILGSRYNDIKQAFLKLIK